MSTKPPAKRYGHFDADGHYVVTDPRTPEPWLHYLIRVDRPGTETFASGVTYAGGGFDVRGTHENTFVDARLHLNDEDEVGRYVYIKDLDTRELWSNLWQPVRNPKQTYTSTLGFGFLEAESACGGVSCTTTMFVPKDFDGWIQDIRIENTGPAVKRLELFPFVPVHMGDALSRLLAGDNDAFFGGAAYDEELRGIVFRRHQGIPVGDDPDEISGMLGNVALFHSTLIAAPTEPGPGSGTGAAVAIPGNGTAAGGSGTPAGGSGTASGGSGTPAGGSDTAAGGSDTAAGGRAAVEYETTTERFFGDRFRGCGDPRAVETGELSSKDTPYMRRGCGAFKHAITLAPGESLSFAVVFVAGSTRDYYLGGKAELKSIVEAVSDPARRGGMLAEVRAWWARYFGRISLSSPDEKIDRGFRWLQYQCQIVYVLNRMKSRFHTGYEYGWGFRDILQDVLFVLPYDTETMKQALLHIATQMFESGQAYHNFFITQPGNKSIEASDDPIWFPAAVIKYCRETGDFSILDEVADYADVREGRPGVRGTILEHCLAGIERVWKDRSANGLPFMKDCDWNDDLNQPRTGDRWNDQVESVMVAQQLYKILLDTAELFEASGRMTGLAPRYRERAQELRGAIFARCLDREGYFKRALMLDPKLGPDLGSSETEFGKIYLEPQIFAVLAGLCDADLARTVLDAVEKHLDSDFGAMLCYPFYTDLAWNNRLPRNAWNIEKEPPGMKENGGIFMHLNAWLVQAYCLAGRGRDAVALYTKTLPENMSADPDNYRTEPYVYPEYVRGTDSDQFGRGGHTWLTGTAPTMHTAVTEYIYGLRPDWAGLLVDPCVDGSWTEFAITRTFRGAVYDIRIANPNGVERGVVSVTVDGEDIALSDGRAVLPVFGDGKTHAVSVTMG